MQQQYSIWGLKYGYSNRYTCGAAIIGNHSLLSALVCQAKSQPDIGQGFFLGLSYDLPQSSHLLYLQILTISE